MDNAGLESMDVMGPLESVGGCEGGQGGSGWEGVGRLGVVLTWPGEPP